MTAPPPSTPHPLGPDAPDRDYVGLAFAGMASGALAGLATMSAALFGVRSLQVGAAAPSAAATATPDLGSPAAMLLFLGTIGGLLTAAVVTWRHLAPIGSTYRQGGLSMVTAFGTLVLALVAFPVDGLLGRWGLLGLALLAAAGTRVMGRRAAGAARELA